MQRIVLLSTAVLMLLTLGTLPSCKKMDSTYKEFIVPGGLVYPAQVSNALVYAGKNRVKVSWLRSSDPSIVKARVYWNNYTDSLEVPVSQQQDTISAIINNLAEQSYTFYVRTFDSKGNASVPTELTGKSVGAQFESNLLSRPINRAILFDDGKLTINWGAANITGGAYASQIAYENNMGAMVYKNFSADTAVGQIADLKPGTKIKFRTVYLPGEAAIDTFYTEYTDLENFYFNKSAWQIIGFSSNHGGDDNKVQNIIDGTYKTRWHTLVGMTYPHFVTADTKGLKTISQFSVARTDYTIPEGDDRGPDTFQLLVSEDNVNWKELGVFNFDRSQNGEQFYAMPPDTRARYFKFVALTGPFDYMSLGEISIYGY